MRLNYRGHHAFHCPGVTDVDRQCARLATGGLDACGDAFRVVAGDIGDHDVRSMGGQAFGPGLTDPDPPPTTRARRPDRSNSAL